MALIEVLEPGRPPYRVPFLPDGKLTVGKSPDSSVRIEVPHVSNHHLSLELRVRVKDLGSRNGTYVGGERVEEATIGNREFVALDPGEEVRLQFSVGPGEGTLSDTVNLAKLTAPLEKKIEELERRVGERDRKIAELEARLEAAPAAAKEKEKEKAIAKAEAAPREAGSTDRDGSALGRLAECQEKLAVAESARRQAETKAELMSRSGFSGAQKALVMLEERQKTIDDLKGSLETAQRRLRDVEAGRDEALSGPAVADLVETFSSAGALGLDDILVETMKTRADIVTDCGFILGRCYRFIRDLEKVITRSAQRLRGGGFADDQTLIPGVMGNFSRSVHGLLFHGGESQTKNLDDYLNYLRIWFVICVSAYESAGKQWIREHLDRTLPSSIRKHLEVSSLKKSFGLDVGDYWKEYESRVSGLAAQVGEDQLDQLASQVALEMAKEHRVV